jgi:VWFA-related protein
MNTCSLALAALVLCSSRVASAQTAVVTGEAEVSTRDEPVTFKVESNLVEVPVVVRDRQGRAVGNLRKEDFRILDKGKPQEISKFSVQRAAQATAPESRAAGAPAEDGHAPASGNGAVAPPAMPNHFVAFVFDDVNIRFEDLPQVRAAVGRYIRSSIGPQDRVALYTTSGRIGVDFTDNPEALSGPLLKIAPVPIGAPSFGTCGTYVSYFQAAQIDEQVGLEPFPSDAQKCLALRVAIEEFGDFHTALQYVRDAYTSGLQETRAALAALKIVVERMAAMPGQRSVVFVSPGLFVPADLRNASSDLTALAIRSKVLIGSINARGVWTVPEYDACRPGAPAQGVQDEVAFRTLEAEAITDELIALAEDTGGTLNLDNDFDGGVRKATATPEYLYVLGFVPQNLKNDGRFHALKVTLSSDGHATLQARRGYWAPNHAEDPVEALRQEMESAVFAREEIHNLPVEMHTRVTKTGDAEKLNVLASVDLKQIHLRKVDDRNRNDVVIVTAVFDANGIFIAGTQKTLQLRLRDETVRGLEQKPPVTIETLFDMRPGSYLVRLVARDAEGQQITAENAAVQIP